MEIAQEKIDLISKIIKSDRKFQNNEDLYEDFLNETCKRSVSIISAIDTEATLEAYLRRIVTTSIISVLKDSGRLRRTGGSFKPTNETPVEKAEETIDYSKIDINYSGIKIPETPEEIVIQKDILEFVAQTIKKLDNAEPDEKYLDICYLRYDKGLTQKEIAAEIGISQAEVSKRLFSLMEKVRSVID